MSGAGSSIYCFDSSSFLHAWRRAYPPRNFKRLWSAFDDLIEADRMVASIEVYNELQRKDDDVFAWAKERREALFYEIDDEVHVATLHIMREYPRLVDTRTGKSGGDPFVIALAITRSPRLVVVHQEVGGSEKSPKIPQVCDREGIEHVDLLGLIAREEWVF